MFHKPLPPSTSRKPFVVALGHNGLVLHMLYSCLEFLCQVGASSANSNPGADELVGHFLEINVRKTGRDNGPPIFCEKNCFPLTAGTHRTGHRISQKKRSPRCQ